MTRVEEYRNRHSKRFWASGRRAIRIVVDSSALVACIQGEPGAENLLAAMRGAKDLTISAPVLFEAMIVMAARRPTDGQTAIQEFLLDLKPTILPFTEAHANEALQCFLKFGKGRHPASLNICDCMSYATAVLANQPLLFVGGDFRKTDIQPAY